MSKAHPPELKKYMDKRVQLKINAGRTVTGILRGFDPYMNIVLDDAVEELSNNKKEPIGMIVSCDIYLMEIFAVSKLHWPVMYCQCTY